MRKNSSLVPEQHRAAKYLSHPLVLAIITWLIVILISNIMVQEVIAMLQHFDGEEISHDIFKQEKTVSVMLVGLGVLLEGRQLLLSWIFNEEELQVHNEKNLACEYYGFLIMSVGLLIEIIDQFLEYAITSSELLLVMEFCVNYPLNLYALYLLVSIGIKLMLPVKRT
jgi:hypothetical protein